MAVDAQGDGSAGDAVGADSAGCSAGGSDGGGGVLVSEAHDLWALVATLCELLSGCPLLPANDEAHFARLYAKLHQLESRWVVTAVIAVTAVTAEAPPIVKPVGCNRCSRCNRCNR